jgi:hypothetical protein
MFSIQTMGAARSEDSPLCWKYIFFFVCLFVCCQRNVVGMRKMGRERGGMKTAKASSPECHGRRTDARLMFPFRMSNGITTDQRSLRTFMMKLIRHNRNCKKKIKNGRHRRVLCAVAQRCRQSSTRRCGVQKYNASQQTGGGEQILTVK